MTAYYMIAEMLPVEELDKHPSYEFAPGAGFESPNCDFFIYGPASCWQDFETDHERLTGEGYEVYFQSMSTPMI